MNPYIYLMERFINNANSSYIPLAKCDCGSDAEIENLNNIYWCGCKDCNRFVNSDTVTKVVNEWNRLMLNSH